MHCRRDQFIGLVCVVLLSVNTLADQKTTDPIQLVEMFTTTERPIADIGANGSGRNRQGLDVLVVEIDGIQAVEHNLSLNLSADPKRSKQVALQRLQQMDEEARTRLKLTAMGLTKTMRYGVDRTPAVVFDGKTVVYGVTDLTVALEHYQAWQRRRRPK